MPKSSSLVSIGLIAYNRGKIIGQSIKSLLSQNYKNIELIISDDASLDKTSTVCRQFAKKDKRIRFFRQKNNIGLAANSNFVLGKARGKYFMWASDDDLWHKDFISTLVGLLEKNKDAFLAAPNFYLFKDSKKYHEEPKLSRTLSGFKGIKIYLSRTPLLVWGLFRTTSLQNCGGFQQDDRPGWIKGSDFITVFKVLLAGEIVFSEKTLFYKRDSGFAVDRKKILMRLKFDKDLRFRITRYLNYFIMFSFDFYYLTKSTFQSSFKPLTKIKIFFYCFLWYIKVNLNHIWEITVGIILVVRGFIMR